MTAALAKTASITLLTAIPGSGKTLRLVGFIKAANAAGEQVFVTNINGLKLPHIPFADPREWRDLPPGSVLVVDEAQNWFRARRSGDPPKYLTDMETIRHHGIRLVLATQQPNYLDTHLRGLVGLHEHLVRVEGQEASTIYRSDEVMDDVKSKKGRASHDSEKWAFPKEDYALYESAQVHTAKYVMSARKKRGIVIACVAAALALGAAWNFRSSIAGPTKDGEALAPDAASLAGRGPVERSPPRDLTALEKHTPDALREWAANLTPRVETLPWSAPIFDDREPVAKPRRFCMESGPGIDANGTHQAGSVRCMTEQGTAVQIDPKAARMLARQGEPYNPYKEEPQSIPRDALPAREFQATGRTAAAPSPVVIQGEQVSGYGDLAVGPGPNTAP